LTYFQVTAEHLKIAQGNVRCGNCRNVFSALGNLTEHLPEPGTDPSDSDFLTDEELGEFEDFDTNIYDDEDSIFDAFIDEDEDILNQEPVSKNPDAGSGLKTRQAEKTAKAAPPPKQTRKPNSRPPSSAAKQQLAAKKLASLKEGQKAYLEKLQQAVREKQQADLEQQTRIFTKPEATGNTSPSAPAARNKPPQTQAREKPRAPAVASPRPKPAARTPAAKTPPARHTAPNKVAKSATKPRAGTNTVATNNLVGTRNTQKRKPDIPVQSSGEEVDFDTALQALDELEINDEHADFVASVIKEFEATNIALPTHPEERTPAPAPETNASATTFDSSGISISKAARENVASPDDYVPLESPPAPVEPRKPTQKIFGWKKSKPKKKIRKKRPKKLPSATPVAQPVIEGAIPTLPAILLEGYHEEAAQHRLTPATIAWGVGSMLLMLVFLGQSVYFKHDQLAHISVLRPWVVSFCHRFNCEVALQYDASQLELLGQDIRSNPKIKDSLMVSTTIINKAGYRQAYPGLQITFTDLNGQRVAMRRFLPGEYLPRGSDIKHGMPSDTPIQVQLELMDPGRNAINFEFDFFKTF